MKKYHILLIAASIIFFTACKKSSNNGNGDVTIAAKTMLDVPYGTDAAQKMDIYLPANRNTTSTKVMIMIHGGAWTAGDKSEFTQYVDTMRNRLPGYAIFNINYRLAVAPSTNLFPTQEQDVKAAFEFIYGNASTYLVNNSKWVCIGASAGGHLAMLQSFKNLIPVKIKAVASLFGPSDMVAMYNNPVGGNALLSLAVAAVVGGTPTTQPLLYATGSPITYINGSSSPAILLHGGVDPLVRPEQSTAVRDKLTLAGVANQYVFYPTGGHGDWNAATYKDAFNNIQAFFEAKNP